MSAVYVARQAESVGLRPKARRISSLLGFCFTNLIFKISFVMGFYFARGQLYSKQSQALPCFEFQTIYRYSAVHLVYRVVSFTD